MIDRIRVARWVVVAGVLLAVGVAGATTKLKRWSAGDACLCTPEAGPPVDLGGTIDPARSSGSFMARNGGIAPSTATTPAGPLASLALAGPADYSAAAGGWGLGGGGHLGWANGWRSKGAASASGGGHSSASLGGLWRLMSLSRHVPSAASAVRVAGAVAERSPRSPGRGPSARPPSTGGGSSASAGPSTSAGAAAPGSDLFAEQHASIPDLLNGGGASPVGGGGGGGPKGKVGKGPNVAATPEPASLLLFGTGLLGVVGILRRRAA